jgi:hypothetical protein
MAKVIGSDWTGRVFAWNAKRREKPAGELESTPPPLAERVQRDTAQLKQLEAELECRCNESRAGRGNESSRGAW